MINVDTARALSLVTFMVQRFPALNDPDDEINAADFLETFTWAYQRPEMAELRAAIAYIREIANT